MAMSQTRSRAGLAQDLRISIARLSRRLRAQSTSGLSITQQAALAAVERHQSMSPRQLAEHEKVQPPSMTRVIAALEEQNLLVRTPHPTDGRQVVLNVTDQGRELLKEQRRRKQAWLSQRLEELTPEERAVLRQAAPILEKLSRS
ncbi:MarR family transcriptional regulator [Actinomadura alba]|uniref:MarR family transcriptional regulator n=2 Tax=Actinomadura alba TaxID=406431 RepID=A0ABR7LM24_9ACTN|nr:MarR family transcriptional regulator [Actinomadura alba]MBC6465644.1 MarR family transcriptional regulator [Actinomadura alba]